MREARYYISSGVLEVFAVVDDSPNERVVYETSGYSGHGRCRNNPDCTAEKGVGPLPVGRYHVLAPVDLPRLGPAVLGLVPYAANDMHGRSGFYVHGDSRERPGDASHGCIILPRSSREALVAFKVTALEVVP
jgi:hypothetical protein